jgi:hypothetical protein
MVVCGLTLYRYFDGFVAAVAMQFATGKIAGSRLQPLVDGRVKRHGIGHDHDPPRDDLSCVFSADLTRSVERGILRRATSALK